MDYSRGLGLGSSISLCYRCSKRQGLDKYANQCYICNGLMDRLDNIFELIKHAIKGYEFNTFLIGVTVDQGIIEREDEIRARLKIKGKASIKNDITSSLSKMLSNYNNTKQDYRDPDLIIHVDLVGNFVYTRSKAIYLSARYRKLKRGLSQKMAKCYNCKGIGCHNCNFKGYNDDSIEAIISSKLIDIYNADSVKFYWLGSEDKDSLVLNQGRPFFVKIINPRRRFIDYKSIRIEEQGIEAWFIAKIDRFPDKPIRFVSRFRVRAYSEDAIDGINAISLDEVMIDSKVKKVYSFSIKLLDPNNVEVDIVADSGLPIKRFIQGDGINPSLASILNKRLKCIYFDVLEVNIKD